MALRKLSMVAYGIGGRLTSNEQKHAMEPYRSLSGVVSLGVAGAN